MIKTIAFVSAILVSICPGYEALVCYNCYTSGSKSGMYEFKLNQCNVENLAASETTVCPNATSKCIYEVIENEHIAGPQVWRMCSDPRYPPCDKRAVPSGFRMLDCTFCDTDKCNLHKNAIVPNNFTININADVHVSIG